MMKELWKALTAAAIFAACASSAQALNARTWISGSGVDQAGCGPVASPCRTLQYAYEATTAGGEIDIKDSAGYGSLTIQKAISVINEGAGIAGVLASAGRTAIYVAVKQTEDVVLRGLTVEGAGVGSYGLTFYGGRSLRIENCLFQNFVGSSGSEGTGIYLSASGGSTGVPSKISIINTTTSNNSYAGVFMYSSYGTSLTMTVDGHQAANNKFGIMTDTSPLAFRGDSSGGYAFVSVTRSLAQNNSRYGFYFVAKAGQQQLFQQTIVEGSYAFSNPGLYGDGTVDGAGIRVEGSMTLFLSRSTSFNNRSDLSIVNGAYVVSAGDNTIYRVDGTISTGGPSLRR